MRDVRFGFAFIIEAISMHMINGDWSARSLAESTILSTLRCLNSDDRFSRIDLRSQDVEPKRSVGMAIVNCDRG